MSGGGQLAKRREKVRADIAVPRVTIAAGEAASVEVEITNLDRVIRSFHVEGLGVDPAYVSVEPPVVDLFPDERATVTVTVILPPDHPAGPQVVGLEIVEPREDAPAPALAEFVVDVVGYPGLELRTEPATLEMGGVGSFLVHVFNTGNTVLDLELVAQDPERLIKVTFTPERASVLPGEQAVVRADVRGPRPWVGMPVVRVLEVTATQGDTFGLSTVALLQQPRIGRRLISFLGLLLVITLFAYIIQLSFGRVAELTAQNEALVKQGLGFDEESTAHAAPAGISGAVVSSTGAGIDGAAVQLFEQNNVLRPLHSTVTNEAGVYRFGAVADGSYLIKTEAAGFGALWYPASLAPEDGEIIEVEDGAPVADLEIVMTGRPGGVEGRVLGAEVEGAIVEVQLPAGTVEGSELEPTPSVVRTTALDATGQFSLLDLATPATYELVVSKVGFATQRRSISLQAGELRDDVEVLLTRGIGRIAGTVVDTAGTPIGGVVVVATDGTSEATTRSLSGDATTGVFELRDLTTPGTYTLSFSTPGFFTETITLTLAEEQQRDDLVVVMTADAGSLGGQVTAADGTPVGGATVSVVGAEVERVTQTFSVDDVGTWLVDSLPVPGTYTVTFQAKGFRTTAVSVDLVPGPQAARRDVDAVLTAATGSIRGTVTDTQAVPIGGVAIVLERAELTRQTISSDDPPGAYVFDGLPPGVYSLTYRRAGSTPQTLLVDVAAGEDLQLDPIRLERQARITGVVTRNGVPTSDIGVVVYRVSEYPGGAVASTVTGPGGTFDLVGLDAPESYIIDFQVPAGGPVVRSRVVFLRPDEVITLEVAL